MATSWISPFYFSRRLLVGLRNDDCSDMTFESQFLTMVERRGPVGKYSRAVAGLNFDRSSLP